VNQDSRFEVKTMVIGEKLWEGKAKTMGMSIKGTNAEGVIMEYTWTAQMKGMGKATGVDAQVIFTGTTTISPSGGGATMGTGLLTTMTGGMAVIKGTGYGKPEMGKGKGVGIWSFMTMSPTLAWMNTAVALVTQEGDAQWTEFDCVVWEWK
jgi:hypothetical protein